MKLILTVSLDDAYGVSVLGMSQRIGDTGDNLRWLVMTLSRECSFIADGRIVDIHGNTIGRVAVEE